MGLLDGVLGQMGGNADVANLAGQLGIRPEMAEKAVAALGQAHQQPGDTAELAAGRTGLDVATIQQIITAIGGESALARFAGEIVSNPQVMALLDRDGDGDAMDDIAGFASGLFGRK
ncbi:MULTISPECIES: hypothetical protein [Novosphingobium]|uniref:DUF937 domain-containing protein n=1 Tax=Novosphingobium decolorationis TaxID=2698673 RepID=A0ABX8E170_9SPHN|nr:MULTISPECIES: hypothetical protein [Novosphingobium]QVM82882.1 hypothetical protein HT578_03435 [Novosphingobium decolorationis]GAM06431.1 hypothetical conserved protein [Novosphingobium sp. MBES04]